LSQSNVRIISKNQENFSCFYCPYWDAGLANVSLGQFYHSVSDACNSVYINTSDDEFRNFGIGGIDSVEIRSLFLMWIDY